MSTPAPPPSLGKRRRRPTRSIPWSSLTLVLICALLWNPPLVAQASKLRLIPKKNKNKNNNNAKQNNKNKKNQVKEKKNHKNNAHQTGKKVILQPRKKQTQTTLEAQPLSLHATISQNAKGEQVLLLTQESAQAVQDAMQSTSTSTSTQEAAPAKSESEPEPPQVLFYDPDQVLHTKAGDAPPLPHAFDEDGNRVDLNGKEVHVVHPHDEELIAAAATGDDESDASSSTTNTTKSSSSTSTKRKILSTTPATQQGHDQMIIISTVATMALLVGALSARRLRSRQFLNFCIENESLEDELAYDAAYTTTSTVGASGFYSSGGGYDTFGGGGGGGDRYGGDLRWRGDLEKFDV